jgi:hypothetical protein
LKSNDDYESLPNQVTLEVPDPEEACLKHYPLLLTFRA